MLLEYAISPVDPGLKSSHCAKAQRYIFSNPTSQRLVGCSPVEGFSSNRFAYSQVNDTSNLAIDNNLALDSKSLGLKLCPNDIDRNSFLALGNVMQT
jgi:hypothetical protein